MASRADKFSVQGERSRHDVHEGFLRHRKFRWLKIAIALGIVAIAVYFWADVKPRPNGGSWYGYTFGTVGLLLILWLTLLGVRKRTMTRGQWSLKAWTSAHVYLGLLLIVIGTLHTGFQFGWNIHVLAYVLMMIVILSGIYGISAYSVLPRALSDSRGDSTQAQMLETVRQIDRQLHEAAIPLDHHFASIVRTSLDDDPFAGGLIARLTGRYPRCGTRSAHQQIRQVTGGKASMGADPLEKIDALLERKESALFRIRRHMQIRARMEVWLYIHVPATIALIAALAAHIVSVFFYW